MHGTSSAEAEGHEELLDGERAIAYGHQVIGI